MADSSEVVAPEGENTEETEPEEAGMPAGGEVENDYDDEEPEREGPPVPTDDEVRAVFKALLGLDPEDADLKRYSGQEPRQAKELMLATDDLVDTMSIRTKQMRGEK